ncbi:hypothetical protein ISN44_As10g009640 [Arabidopsis suecica]|uniref:Uncharacterized protein n=1 Tax=Arabidopsis suecica TaxID=45249 RepID=A0A8T1ZXI6_ARASU|nr:hypothetical protein ISN44_As10g009640 [Arabidopsis suecica]
MSLQLWSLKFRETGADLVSIIVLVYLGTSFFLSFIYISRDMHFGMQVGGCQYIMFPGRYIYTKRLKDAKRLKSSLRWVWPWEE